MLRKMSSKWLGMFVLALCVIWSIPAAVYAESGKDSGGLEKYVTIGGKQVRTILYGDMNASKETFADDGKQTLVMLPALAVPSPNIYFKPLAQALQDRFHVIVVEPLGYGLSDQTAKERTVENINEEIYEVLEQLDVEKCVLLTHSISGIYGLNFVETYPEKVDGFIAIDNTVYDAGLAEALKMEQQYILQGAEEFDALRNTFQSLHDFQNAIASNPDEYGAALPKIAGYTYTEQDREEYLEAYSRSSNETVRNEISLMEQASNTIIDKKFPSDLSVLMMISSDNVDAMPVWETAHYKQLNFEGGNHEIHIVEGGHYIWYTNLTEIIKKINSWQESLTQNSENNFVPELAVAA